MKKITIKSLSIVLAVVMLIACLPVSAYAEGGDTAEAQPKQATGLDTLPAGQELVAKAGDFELYVNLKTSEFSVYNKKSGYLWTHGIDKSQYEMTVSGTWGKRTTSVLEIRHFDNVSKEATTKSAFAPGDCSKVTVKKIKNGVECVYDFGSVGISATTEITLDEDGLSVYIPADKLVEGEKRGIVSIAVLPGFGSGGQGEEGYIVYPDGAGGLTDFTKRNERPKSISEEAWYIYGTDAIDIDNYLAMMKTETQIASLPMYGIVKDKNGLLAMIEEGDYDAMIRLQVAGYPATLDLYRCFFEFTYRHVYSQYMSNITINGKDQAENATVQRTESEINATDKRVRYVLVSGDNANYSGIASAYRDMLIDNGTLSDKIGATDKMPLGVDFFIGIIEDMGIYKAQTVVTTFENCRTILKALKDAGVDNIEAMLKGWEKDGYDALPNVSVNSKAGGIRGLVSLSEFAKENNITVSLFTNFMLAYEENGGFSLKNDILYNGANIPIASKKYSNVYILTPRFSAENHERMLKNIAAAADAGIAYGTITKYLYFDYHNTSKITRDGTGSLWKEMFAEAAEQGRSVAVEYGNLYSLTSADRVFNIPIKSTRKYTCDRDVPLVQLVLHGILPYSSEPLNLSSDLTETKLKWVEFGCMPMFELTYESSSLLKKTAYNKLFSSQYEKWIDKAVDMYEEFNKNLGTVWGETITNHTVIKEGFVRVEYANSTRIYINYNEVPETADGITVPATEYKVVAK